MKSHMDSSTTNPIFLPNFLLGGDPNPPTCPAIPEISLGGITAPGSFKPTAKAIKGRSLRQKLFNESLTEISPPTSPYFVPACEKAGPPKIGLFDTIHVAHHGDTKTFNKIISEATLNSRKYPSSNEIEKNKYYWVTVFGFPSTALNIVLSLLSTCGTITQRNNPQGNWVHIRFSNFNEVAKALSLNGTLIFDNVMIGVQSHYPSENKKNMAASPIKPRFPRHFSIIPQERYNNVTPGPDVPRKCTDLLNKTIDYLFGW